MTKVRPPLSFERAIGRIHDHVGWPAMAAALGKSVRTVQDYGDHDTSTGISLADAFTLTDLYRQNGGVGDPIGECWDLRLGVSRAAADPEPSLLEHTAECIQEAAEAHTALILASAPGATDADRATARRELEQSIAQQTGTLALFNDGTGPKGGVGRAIPVGGNHDQ